MSNNWGGPNRGGGAYPKNPEAALDKAIAAVERRLAVCRKQGISAYVKRSEVFKRLDRLQEQAEVYMCEAPDYPDEEDALLD